MQICKYNTCMQNASVQKLPAIEIIFIIHAFRLFISESSMTCCAVTRTRSHPVAGVQVAL